MEFEGDELKNATTIGKHGISRATAARIFEGWVLTDVDTRFDYGEVREISIGKIAEWSSWLSCTRSATAGSGSSPLVRQIAAKGNAMKKRYERELNLEELARVPDSEIDYSDIPELDDAFWKNARLIQPRRPKEQVTIRFDADVLDWFRQRGKGYQTHMNAVLRAYVDAQK